MQKQLIQECPLCGNILKVKELYCPSCSTTIRGSFEPPRSRIFYLPHKDLEFIELFVRLRGNIKEVEKAMGLSYPTVRGLLDTVIKRMGYKVEHDIDKKKRMEIIEKLEKGELSAEQATNIIRTGVMEDSTVKQEDTE